MDRVTLKESVGKAISYGISPGTADRIGAFAHAGKLGMLLWEWRYGGQPKGLEAENLMTRIFAKRFRVRHVGKQKQAYLRVRLAARQSLKEWFTPECHTCNGVKEVSGEFKREVCPTCNGEGIKRYTDYERAASLGVSVMEYRAIWDIRFRAMRDSLGGEDGVTGSIVRDQLKNTEIPCTV